MFVGATGHLHSNLVIFKYENKFVMMPEYAVFTFQSGDIQIYLDPPYLLDTRAFTFQSGDIQIS